MITNQKIIEEPDSEFCYYTFDLEKAWRISLPRFSDKELLAIFPQAKRIIPKKISEWAEVQDGILDTIKKKLTLIKNQISDTFSQWFWREWVKVTDGEELLRAGSQIAQLKRLMMTVRGRKLDGRLTEEQIQQALAVSIENLINQPLRKSGKALVGLCPFHNEKHPSFYIYPETNSCWCYGCNQGGNVINFLRLLHGYSFKEAVRYLIEK